MGRDLIFDDEEPRGKFVAAALPSDSDGRTYITDEMLANDPGLGEFLARTRDSWWRDQMRQCYVLKPIAVLT